MAGPRGTFLFGTIAGFLLIITGAVMIPLGVTIPGTEKARSLVGTGIVAGLTGICLLYVSWKDRGKKIFQKDAEKYLDLPDLAQSPQTPYIRGRVVPVTRHVHLECSSDLRSRTIQESLFSWLPAKLRPGYADDVGTILWLDWDERTVGTYEGGHPACLTRCTLTIVDTTLPAVIHEHTWTWEAPRALEVLNGRPVYSIWQRDQEIAEYIKKLPRKAIPKIARIRA